MWCSTAYCTGLSQCWGWLGRAAGDPGKAASNFYPLLLGNCTAGLVGPTEFHSRPALRLLICNFSGEGLASVSFVLTDDPLG